MRLILLHDPAVGWGDIMLEENGLKGMLARVVNTWEHLITPIVIIIVTTHSNKAVERQ
jgi:hypothetical protein